MGLAGFNFSGQTVGIGASISAKTVLNNSNPIVTSDIREHMRNHSESYSMNPANTIMRVAETEVIPRSGSNQDTEVPEGWELFNWLLNSANTVKNTVDSVGATVSVGVTSVVKGASNIVEEVFDGALMYSLQKSVSIGLPVAALSALAFTNDETDRKIIGEAVFNAFARTVELTKSVVKYDAVDNLYKWFYEGTETGRSINDASYMKYDGNIAGKITRGTDIVCMGAISAFTGPAGLFIAGFRGMGAGASQALKDGASYHQALNYGACRAVLNAGLTKITSKGGQLLVGNIFGNLGSEFVSSIGGKISMAGVKSVISGVSSAVSNVLETGAQLTYKYNTEQTFAQNFTNLFNERGGWTGVAAAAVTGGVSSLVYDGISHIKDSAPIRQALLDNVIAEKIYGFLGKTKVYGDEGVMYITNEEYRSILTEQARYNNQVTIFKHDAEAVFNALPEFHPDGNMWNLADVNNFDFINTADIPILIPTYGPNGETIYTVNGVEFILPAGFDPSKQPIRIEDVIYAFDALPDILKERTYKVYLLDTPGSSEGVAASAGWGEIEIYATNGSPMSETDLTALMVHEAVHNLDSAGGGWWSQIQNGSWINMIMNDFIISGFKSPTEYGTTELAEDFAESITIFMNDPNWLRNLFPNRFGFIESIFSSG